MRASRPASARGAGRQFLPVRPRSAQAAIAAPRPAAPPPPPDTDGIVSGPGRNVDFPPDAKFVLKDPLRDGEDGRALYAFCAPAAPGACEPAPREGGAPRTLNISKLNEGRHNWQRIDTFNTPWGHGVPELAASSTASGRASPGPASPEPGGAAAAGTTAPAGTYAAAVAEAAKGLASTVVMDGFGELRQDLVQAVNCIVAELRADIKAEACAQRQASSKLLDEVRLVRAELPTNMGPPPPPDLQPVLTAVRETSREQAEAAIRSASASAAAAVRAELAKAVPMGEELAPLLRGKPSEPGCLKVKEEIGCISLQGSIEERLAEIAAVLREVQQATLKLDQSPVLRTLEQTKAELTATCRVEPYFSQILQELKLLRTSTDPAPVLEAVRSWGRGCEAGETRLLAASREIQTALAGLELQRLAARDRAAAGGEAELAALVASVREDLSKRDADRAAVLQAVREREASFDFSEVLREMQRLRSSVDFAPVLRAIGEKTFEVDFSAVLREIREKTFDIDLSALLREIRDLRLETDLPSVLRELREVKSSLDLSPLVAAIRETRTEVQRAKSEVDFSAVLAELRRKDEAAEASLEGAVSRALARREAGEPELAAALRALQDAVASAAASHERRADSDTARIVRELQCRPASADLAPVLAAIRSARTEADSAVVAAVRSSIAQIDFSQILAEMRRVKSEIDYSLTAVRDSKPRADTGRQDLADVLKAFEDRKLAVDFTPILLELRRLRAELDPAAVAKGAREEALEQVLHEVQRSGREQLAALKAVRPESGLAAVLDAVRQTTTRSDFAMGMEELRGHFSAALKAISQADAGGLAAGMRPHLESMVVDAVQQVESRRCRTPSGGADLQEVLRKLWEIQQLMAKMGSSNYDVTLELQRLSRGMPPGPECPPPLLAPDHGGSLALGGPTGKHMLPQQ